MSTTLREQIMDELMSERAVREGLTAAEIGRALGCSGWEACCHLADLRRLRLVRADGDFYKRDTRYLMTRTPRAVA